jgi:HEAT repeat protein
MSQVFDVRWLASEGLITIGPPALLPLLRELVKRPDSLWLREGTHHVLRGIDAEDIKRVLKPVLNALEDTEGYLKVPFAAEAALKQLGTEGRSSPTRMPEVKWTGNSDE